MATNLRLRSDAEEALRIESARTGRSQQDIIRTAIDQYLRPEETSIPTTSLKMTELEILTASGLVMPPRTPFSAITNRLQLPPGATTADLLDRDDRDDRP